MVLADGCFDPLHWGHVRYLQKAAKCGETLMVRVAPDTAIIAKGRTPFQTQDERSKLLLALGIVDRVCVHETLAQAIRDFTPSCLVKGSEWDGCLPEDVLLACHETGTAVVFTTTQERTSTERLRA